MGHKRSARARITVHAVSLDTDVLHVPGSVEKGSKFGLTTLRVSEQVSRVQRSWCSEERCVAVLLGKTPVMSVCVLLILANVWRSTRILWEKFKKSERR